MIQADCLCTAGFASSLSLSLLLDTRHWLDVIGRSPRTGTRRRKSRRDSVQRARRSGRWSRCVFTIESLRERRLDYSKAQIVYAQIVQASEVERRLNGLMARLDKTLCTGLDRSRHLFYRCLLRVIVIEDEKVLKERNERDGERNGAATSGRSWMPSEVARLRGCGQRWIAWTWSCGASRCLRTVISL